MGQSGVDVLHTLMLNSLEGSSVDSRIFSSLRSLWTISVAEIERERHRERERDRERERQRDRDRERDRERQRQRERVCV